MGPLNVPDRVFHSTPFCFAASWILLLSCLSRNSVLTLSADLTKLADEIRNAAPNYFLNVPLLLERMRTNIGGNLHNRGGLSAKIFDNALAGGFRVDAKTPQHCDFFVVGFAALSILLSL